MPGHERVLFSGLLEWEKENENLQTDGVLLHQSIVNWINDCLEKNGS